MWKRFDLHREEASHKSETLSPSLFWNCAVMCIEDLLHGFGTYNS